MSGGHAPGTDNKLIALMIALIALSLAFAENFGGDARTRALAYNIEASNLWNFFQAKTIRQTVLRGQAEEMETILPGINDAAVKEAATKRVEAWKTTAQRYETEPETNEGRRELVARAKEAEKQRDYFMAKHEKMEIAAAILQIAIVLASAMIITGITPLGWIAAGLGVAGSAIVIVGKQAPTTPLLSLVGLG